VHIFHQVFSFPESFTSSPLSYAVKALKDSQKFVFQVITNRMWGIRMRSGWCGLVIKENSDLSQNIFTGSGRQKINNDLIAAVR